MTNGLDKVPNVLLIEARFYNDLTDELAAGAMEAIEAAGATCARLPVPGALEIPAAISFASKSDEFDAYVALGVVIRGETSHYDIVCEHSSIGLQQLALEQGLCIGNGVLTVENDEQAWARADRKRKNKGADAANAALRMLAIKARFTPAMLEP